MSSSTEIWTAPGVAVEPEPTLEGLWVRLRATQESDLDWLYALHTRAETITRFRSRGRTPSPEEFRRGLWANALANFVISTRTDPEPVGLVSLFGPNHAFTRAQMGIIVRPEYHRKGWPMEALPLAVAYAFATWPFAKLYFEALESNVASQQTGFDRWVQREVVLPDHEFRNGRYESMQVYSLDRSRWDELRLRMPTGSTDQ